MLTGYSTRDALRILRSELEDQLNHYNNKRARLPLIFRLRDCYLHHLNARSVLHFTSLSIIVLSVILTVAAYAVQPYRDNWLMVEVVVLVCLLLVNVYFVSWDDELRHAELGDKARRLIARLDTCIKSSRWTSSSYVDLNCPLSQCVSLQWTIRDSCVVNLPCTLLVEGDVILLRPGQIVCVQCRRLKGEDEEDDGTQVTYESGDLYNPAATFCEPRLMSKVEARHPLKPQPFVVLETPFAGNFRLMLEQSTRRPVGMLDNERYAAYSVWCERRILPSICLLMLTVNTLRYVFLRSHVGHWSDMLIVLQIQAVMPLVALVFPVIWRFLDMYGIAKIDLAFDDIVRNKVIKQRAVSSGENSPHDDSLDAHVEVTFSWHALYHRVKLLLLGQSDTLPRTASLVQVLGNMTSFCCIDKKGVLSWPNPTAEKVFILTDVNGASQSHSAAQRHLHSSRHQSKRHSIVSAAGDELTPRDSHHIDGHVTQAHNRHLYNSQDQQEASVQVQVLDLTQDTKNQYGLRFDDPSWQRYVNSLKPLGLSILLNTCNLRTADRYTEFADHVTCVSLKCEEAVPVVNRRCFCELARQIGFSDEAATMFETLLTLGMYRHIPAECSLSDKLRSLKSFTKYKMPMPNMFSVIVKDTGTGMKQMFSQGMADVLLDACSDFWDGHDIRPLGAEERKKIADFYNRTSMSSYCTAYAYRPVVEHFSEDMADLYLEVPEEISLFKNPLTSRLRAGQSCRDGVTTATCYHSSADSLLIGHGSVHSTDTVECINDCFVMQCNQIFIGMITMQYQAKQEIVDLIENLESACIRFVHFSKENELRSRVFSEKMGLEAGWNCHICLRCEHSTDASAAVQGTEMSQGYASALGSVKIESLPGLGFTVAPDVVRDEWYGTRRHRVRCNSAPDVMLFHSASERQRKSVTSVKRRRDDVPAAAACSSELLDDDSLDDSQMPLMLQQYKADVTLRHQQISERSMSMHEHRRRSSSVRTASLSSADRQRGRVMHADQLASTVVELRDDGKTDDLTVEKLNVGDNGDDDDDDDDGSVASYVLSRRSSYTDSLPPGLGNRARLPKGVKNIRPHIDNVDNVPLLVSLFTDCTPHTTREMVQILQEYGGVVCCFGSSANVDNTATFLQADCSLAVEPQYPQLCIRQSDVVKPVRSPASESVELLEPMELSAILNSLPCSLSFTDDDHLIVIQTLVALARHHCQRVRSVMLFYLKFQSSVTLLLLLNYVLLLPPILSSQLVLWLSCFVVPLLSFTLMGNPLNRQVAQMAQGKNQTSFVKQTLLEELIYFAVRYIPSLLVCLGCHAANLLSFCSRSRAAPVTLVMLNESVSVDTVNCHLAFGAVEHNATDTWNGWLTDYNAGLTLSQQFAAAQLVLIFIGISLCSVHQLDYLWRKSPFDNRLWCLVAPVILVLQIICFTATVTAANSVNSVTYWPSDIPSVTWAVSLTWPLVLIGLYELVKKREIKTWVRRQKRARLDFGTKLGMNSPF